MIATKVVSVIEVRRRVSSSRLANHSTYEHYMEGFKRLAFP